MNKADQKFVRKIGWTASFMSLILYFSFFDQIRLNLSGHPGSIILSVVTVFNCSFWVAYGALMEKKSWPIIVCNVPGIFIGAAAAITAYIATYMPWLL